MLAKGKETQDKNSFLKVWPRKSRGETYINYPSLIIHPDLPRASGKVRMDRESEESWSQCSVSSRTMRMVGQGAGRNRSEVPVSVGWMEVP